MTMLDHSIGGFDAVDLDGLNAQAAMLHRKDRKYLVEASSLAAILGGLPTGTRRLETDAGSWARYESVYFDTSDLDLYRLAARRRPHRCKVRLRRYLDSGHTMVEIKAKDAAGKTIKHRRPADAGESEHFRSVASLAAQTDESARYVHDLRPVLTTRYQRATLLLPPGHGRVTIDMGCYATDPCGQHSGIGDLVIIETKTSGKPSPMDRLLWALGHRPVKYSKYCTAMAALHPTLPSNRWHRVLRFHTSPLTLKGARP